MAGEIWHNYLTSKILYAAIFDSAGLVFLTDGSASEIWGTSGDADFYDITMAETTVGASMHYRGTFPAAITAAATYRITVFEQAGANPADSDIAIAHGEFYWDGEAELTIGLIGTSSGTVTHTYIETRRGNTSESAPAPVVYVE